MRRTAPTEGVAHIHVWKTNMGWTTGLESISKCSTPHTSMPSSLYSNVIGLGGALAANKKQVWRAVGASFQKTKIAVKNRYERF